MKSTNKDMADSLFYWGVAKIYNYGLAVRATSWNAINEKTKNKIERKTTILANRIKKNHGTVRPSLKTRGFFSIMRLMQKSGWNEADSLYWKEKGWTGKKRPWK